jgi:3-methyl-2-oxobutanoate hydroxymethyltransferase
MTTIPGRPRAEAGDTAAVRVSAHKPESHRADEHPPADASPRKPVTLRTLVRMSQRGEKFACLTCYDATTARWLERAGLHVLLVGDTAAEVILGMPSTIHAPLDFLLTLTAAVKRGAPNTFVMGDMPFMSYQADEAEGIRNAGRFLTEGMADSVKLEADRSFAALVAKIAHAGVPVVAHIGTRPQLAKMRGYRASGRTAEEAQALVADAIAMEEAGASMLLIEAAPNEVSQRIVEQTSLPVIGCGAGTACHGQVVVLQDILGLTHWQPSFARPLMHLGDEITAAAQRWMENVRRGDLGEHPYQMEPADRERFQPER